MTAGRCLLLHPDVLPQKRRHIEVLAFHNRRLAFFEAPARDRLELQNFLFRLDKFLLHRFRLRFWNRFVLRQIRRGSGVLNDRWWRRDFFNRRRLFKWNEIDGRRGFSHDRLGQESRSWHRHLADGLGHIGWKPMPLLLVPAAAERELASERWRAMRRNIDIGRKRTDDRNAEPVSHSSVNRGSEKDLRPVVHVTPEFFHQDFHFRQRHRRSARDLNQNVSRIGKHSAFIHQRIFQCLRKRIMRAIVGYRPRRIRTSSARFDCARRPEDRRTRCE